MAIVLRDEHLETLLDAERIRRGDATMAKTLGDLVREYLTRLDAERRASTDRSLPEAAAASA